jgi:hypothetical protein
MPGRQPPEENEPLRKCKLFPGSTQTQQVQNILRKIRVKCPPDQAWSLPTGGFLATCWPKQASCPRGFGQLPARKLPVLPARIKELLECISLCRTNFVLLRAFAPSWFKKYLNVYPSIKKGLKKSQLFFEIKQVPF